MVYTKIVERSEWAKAHFFIAIAECRILAGRILTAKITEIAERIGSRKASKSSKSNFWAAGKARLLRIYIDKPEGVSHADCELISQRSERCWTPRSVPGEGIHWK